jgi:hypothetical protein
MAIPITATTAGNTARALVEEVFLRYGYPHRLLSDRGTPFRNELMAAICADSKVKKLFTSAEHPQANGRVERLNGTLKQIINTCGDVFGPHWPDALPFAVFAYNTSRQTTTGLSPYYQLYGFEASSPATRLADSIELDLDTATRPAYADLLLYNQQTARSFVESVLQDKKRLVEVENAALARVPSYREGEMVWLKSSANTLSTAPPFTGPWRVVKRLGETTYRLIPIRDSARPASLQRLVTTVHVGRMKPYHARDQPDITPFNLEQREAPHHEPYELPMPAPRLPVVKSEPRPAGAGSSSAPPLPKEPSTRPPAQAAHTPTHSAPPIVVPTEPAKPAKPDSPAASVLSRRRQGWRLNYDERALMPDSIRPASHSSHSRAHLASRTPASAPAPRTTR